MNIPETAEFAQRSNTHIFGKGSRTLLCAHQICDLHNITLLSTSLSAMIDVRLRSSAPSALKRWCLSVPRSVTSTTNRMSADFSKPASTPFTIWCIGSRTGQGP